MGAASSFVPPGTFDESPRETSAMIHVYVLGPCVIVFAITRCRLESGVAGMNRARERGRNFLLMSAQI